MPLAQFKLKKANASTKLANFPEQPSWKVLTARIESLFQIPSGLVSVAFIDEGGETITLNSQQELQDFYESSYQPSQVTKFVVRDIKDKDGECAFRRLT
jgi:PB1 domain